MSWMIKRGLLLVFLMMLAQILLSLFVNIESVQVLFLGKALTYEGKNAIFYFMGTLFASAIFLTITILKRNEEEIEVLKSDLEAVNQAVDAINDCKNVMNRITDLNCRLAGGIGQRLKENAKLASIFFNNSPEIFKFNNYEAMNILLQHEEYFNVWLKENEKLCGELYEREYQEQKQLAESCDREIYKRIAGYVFKEDKP
jgi:hypothetical protein